MTNIQADSYKKWNEAQEWEREWHDDCANSFNEEAKQYIYARRMGLDEFITRDRGGRLIWDYGKRDILDVGGGPYSMLMKSKAHSKVVVDPCAYPEWVSSRYKAVGVHLVRMPAEDMHRAFGVGFQFDIALIYNCLQHTIDPEFIIKNTKEYAKEIRIFEWVDTGTSDGHLHDLKADNLDRWLGGQGKVEDIKEGGCWGRCYYGIFPI